MSIWYNGFVNSVRSFCLSATQPLRSKIPILPEPHIPTAVPRTSSESTRGNQLLSYEHIASVTHLDATLTRSPAKRCKQKTYRNANSFRCNIYTKRGGGGPSGATLLLAIRLSIVDRRFRPCRDCQPPQPRSSRITASDSPLVVSYG